MSSNEVLVDPELFPYVEIDAEHPFATGFFQSRCQKCYGHLCSTHTLIKRIDGQLVWTSPPEKISNIASCQDCTRTKSVIHHK